MAKSIKKGGHLGNPNRNLRRRRSSTKQGGNVRRSVRSSLKGGKKKKIKMLD